MIILCIIILQKTLQNKINILILKKVKILKKLFCERGRSVVLSVGIIKLNLKGGEE